MESCGSAPLHISMFLADRDDAPHIQNRDAHGGGRVARWGDQADKTVMDLAGRDYSLVEMVKDEKVRREKATSGGREMKGEGGVVARLWRG